MEPPIELGEWQPLPDTACDAIEEFDAEGFTIDEAALAESSAQRAGLLDDELRTEHLASLRAAPERAQCLDAKLAAGSISTSIRRAAELAGDPIDVPPFGAVEFEAGLEALCALAVCKEERGALPADLRAVLGPLLMSIADGLSARAERDASQADGGRTADWWRTYTGNGLIFDPEGQGYDPDYGPDRAYLTGDRSGLYGAAARIAHAVESIDWSAFAGRTGVRFDLETEAGLVRVRDSADDAYLESEPTLLLIDLGGADLHRDEIASNLSGANAVSIAIDVAGDDDYGYDGDDLRFEGDQNFGPVSMSNTFRQGAARNGIAMLFDLEGRDSYRSLRGSQGYAHQGIGVLFDAAGDDRYVAEAVSQGAAQFGIGLLIDGGGNDEYASVFASQGFGFVGGVGIARDDAGHDRWTCDSELLLYPSAQLPGRANVSLCQGAGFGLRSDDPSIAMSGGLGVLEDGAGDDAYSAGVYAQGTGYWQGVGLLSDRGGDDRYDALYYSQGAGVHYAAGVLIDHGGDDVRGGARPSENFSIAAAYDYSVGVLFDLGGREDVRFLGRGVATASEGSLALYLDRGGDDRYEGRGRGHADRGSRSLLIDP